MTAPGNSCSASEQRVPQRQVQVVGRLIEQQQIRAARHQDRERQPRALPAGEVEGGLEHPLAAKAEAAQVVALLLQRPGGDLRPAAAHQLTQRRAAAVELLDLELREETDGQLRRRRARAGLRRELPRHQRA